MIEDYEVVPPCRQLYRDGQPCDEVITVRERFNENYTRVTISPAQSTPYIPHVTRGPGRPRSGNPKRLPPKNPGRRTGVRHPEITAEQIQAKIAEGKNRAQIARELGCSRRLVYWKLDRASARTSSIGDSVGPTEEMA